MLLAMMFSCQPVTENNDSNNTTQEGGNNNGGSNNDGNNSGNENGGNNQGGENNGGNSNTEKPAEKITITFDLNGIDETLPTTVIETTSNKSVYLPILTNSKFSHWNTKADGSGLSYKDSAIFVESVTLYAILLAENAHKITYVLDGGVNNPQNSFSFTEDDYISLKNPSKDGYKFLGWYDNKNFSGNAIKGWAAGDKTANVILYAKWEKEVVPVVKITITFDVNGAGGTAPTAIETTPDENVELPVLTNAKFSHWNTKADGSGLSYKGSAIFAESVTLYAILLAENAHKITYELDGGVNHPKNKYSFTEDDVVILREPTRENCIFVGWYESPDFSGEKIELWYEGYKTANVTLYAKWIVGYTITYELNGGINDSSNLSFFTEDDYSIHVYAPTRDGYRFCGWYETEDFTDSSISYFYTSENLRNITLYAKWEQIIPGIYLSGLYDLNNSAHWAADDNPGTAFAMTECENDVWTFTFTAETTQSFPYGFKFTTEKGWLEQYQAYDKNNPTDDFAILQLDKEAGVYFATKAEVEAPDEDGNRIPDNATKFSLGVNNKFRVGGEYTITFDKANMKVKITGDFADIPTYTIEYVLTESWKSDFTPITKRYSGEEVELPTIENVDTEKDVASHILKWYTTETFETGTEIKKIYGDAEKNMTLYGKIEEGYKTTADGFLKTIQSLSAGGPHNVIVTGELTSSQLSTMATYIKNYSTRKINLDLSGTTGLTSINSNTFSGCTGLIGITIPDSVTSIDYNAFYNCSSLTSFNVSVNNRYYSSSDDGKILYNKNKTTLCAYPSATGDVTIPDSVTSIGWSAFYDCSSLTSVTIGNSVTSIGWSAFRGCSSLESVTIGNSVTSIGSYAFDYCSSLTSVHITDLTAWMNIKFESASSNPLYNGADLYLNGSLVTDLVIPAGMTSIGKRAFCGCSSLTSVTIPDSVTSIDNGAFYNCDGLTSVTIPDSVTYIGEGAFSGCDNLVITISGDEKVIYSQDGTTILLCDGSVKDLVISEDVAFINSGAFAGCKNVETIVTGDTLMSLSGLPITSALKSITIGNGVTSIGYEAFYNCSSLASVTIPDSVTSIDNGAFYNCSSLESVTIGNSVTSIGYEAFYNCSSLASVTIPDSVTSIDSGAFKYCSSLASVTIPDSVTSIGEYAFRDCSSLESVTIGNSVTSIGNYAFSGCDSLTNVTFEDTSTWYYTSNYDYTDGTVVDVIDTAQNATYLTSTYYWYYWYKE